MRCRSQGQSLVEMALIAPLLFTILFAIVDAGFWMYGYGTIYNAARRASEQASLTPPFPSQVSSFNLDDGCMRLVVSRAADNAQFFAGDGATYDFRNSGGFNIRYPARRAEIDGVYQNLTENHPKLRYVGGQIEVTIIARADFLTPISQLLGLGKTFTISATSRRTIENLGIDPVTENNILCTDTPS